MFFSGCRARHPRKHNPETSSADQLLCFDIEQWGQLYRRERGVTLCSNVHIRANGTGSATLFCVAIRAKATCDMVLLLLVYSVARFVRSLAPHTGWGPTFSLSLTGWTMVFDWMMTMGCRQGEVYAWGHNRVAQLGIGNSFTVPRNKEGAHFLPSPQLVESLLGMVRN